MAGGVNWNKIAADLGGGTKGDVAHIAHQAGFRRVEKRVWADSGRTTFHDIETGERIHRADAEVYMRSRLLEKKYADTH